MLEWIDGRTNVAGLNNLGLLHPYIFCVGWALSACSNIVVGCISPFRTAVSLVVPSVRPISLARFSLSQDGSGTSAAAVGWWPSPSQVAAASWCQAAGGPSADPSRWKQMGLDHWGRRKEHRSCWFGSMPALLLSITRWYIAEVTVALGERN